MDTDSSGCQRLIGYARACYTEWVIPDGDKRIPLCKVYLDGGIVWVPGVKGKRRYRQVYENSREYKERLKDLKKSKAKCETMLSRVKPQTKEQLILQHSISCYRREIETIESSRKGSREK